MSGLLMVLADSPQGRDTEFNTWYDQHAAARLTVPGIESAQRYRAVDGQPQYMANYDLADPAVLDSSEYIDLRANRPPGEQEMIDSLPAPLDRRVYRKLGERINDGYSLEVATHVVGVWMSVTDPEDFAAWYEEEHIGLLFQVPGWLRCRRYELVSGEGPQFLALHDLASLEAESDPAAAPARNTEWRNRVIEYRTAYERRVYSLLKRF